MLLLKDDQCEQSAGLTAPLIPRAPPCTVAYAMCCLPTRAHTRTHPLLAECHYVTFPVLEC